MIFFYPLNSNMKWSIYVPMYYMNYASFIISLKFNVVKIYRHNLKILSNGLRFQLTNYKYKNNHSPVFLSLIKGSLTSFFYLNFTI